jgi:hypothetical protein
MDHVVMAQRVQNVVAVPARPDTPWWAAACRSPQGRAVVHSRGMELPAPSSVMSEPARTPTARSHSFGGGQLLGPRARQGEAEQPDGDHGHEQQGGQDEGDQLPAAQAALQVGDLAGEVFALGVGHRGLLGRGQTGGNRRTDATAPDPGRRGTATRFPAYRRRPQMVVRRMEKA